MTEDTNETASSDAKRTTTYVRIDPVTGSLTRDRMTICSEH